MFRNHDSELEGTKTGSSDGRFLKVVLDFLVNRNSARPTCWGIGATLDVAWEQFRTSQQAPNATHVVVPVTSHSVAYTIKDKGLVFEWFKWLQ